jgi:ketosteroid isomerase-like protein
VTAADPRDVIRQLYAGWNDGDVDSMLALYHPDAVFDASDRVFNPDVYRGHEELRRFSAEVDRDWERWQVELERVIELDAERLLVLMRSRARGRASGIELEEHSSAAIWTIREGLVVNAKLFSDRADAFAEARIPDPSAG